MVILRSPACSSSEEQALGLFVLQALIPQHPLLLVPGYCSTHVLWDASAACPAARVTRESWGEAGKENELLNKEQLEEKQVWKLVYYYC